MEKKGEKKQKTNYLRKKCIKKDGIKTNFFRNKLKDFGIYE